jgi:hypothetical protein
MSWPVASSSIRIWGKKEAGRGGKQLYKGGAVDGGNIGDFGKLLDLKFRLVYYYLWVKVIF